MKILIVTQVVDKPHPVLGFFHRWIEEFAVHAEQVEVIALQVGTYSFGDNVHVHSLGKEQGAGRLQRLWRFYTLLWAVRRNYDVVFVHMNPIYVVLGGLWWRCLRKPIGLWYTHGSVSRTLRIASRFAQVIFTASADSFKLATPKVRVTGHGIDTGHFSPTATTRMPLYTAITVSRLSRTKNIEALIQAWALLPDQTTTLAIVGTPLTSADTAYVATLHELIEEKQLSKRVLFLGAVGQRELPATLATARVFVTAAQNGSLDKTVLEALATGLPVVSMAPGTLSLGTQVYQVPDVAALAQRIETMPDASDAEKQERNEHIKQEHGLQTLIPRILAQYPRG